MKLDNIDNHKRGWLVGAFDESILKKDVEVGIQFYDQGHVTDIHAHQFCDEINVICNGYARFYHYKFVDGQLVQDEIMDVYPKDIYTIEVNEIVKFEAITDCCVTCIKTASNKDDKVIYDNPI